MRSSLAFLSCALLARAEDVVVTVEGGDVQGIVTDDGVASFQGIPYATAERWQSPQAHPGWEGVLDVRAPLQIGCPQICTLPPITCPPVTQEDCQLLNVYAPAAAVGGEGNHPVMIFIHGGNFKGGFAGGALYNGTVMAGNNDVVVVAINYRLGALGFLKHKEIQGNYGLEDQRSAMGWVKRNIVKFGGDPAQVTLFGQSAGAQSVSIHSLNPNIKAEFGVTKVIMESNPWSLKYRTDGTWGGVVHALAKASGCECIPEGCIAKCLKKLDVDALLQAQATAETNLLYQLNDLLALFEPWTPTQGSDLLPMHPLRAFQQGKQNQDLTYMSGSVEDEGLMFIYEALGKPVPKLEYEALVAALLGAKAGKAIVSHFPFEGDDARPLLSTIATDGLFHCPGRSAVSAISQAAWLYNFDHPMSFYGNGSFGGTQPECAGRTCHAGELPFVFFPDNIAEVLEDHSNYTSDEVILGDAANRYWGTFAREGEPGEGSALRPLKWEHFTSGSGPMLKFSTPPSILGDDWAQKCAFWEDLAYPWLDSSEANIAFV